MRFSILKTNSRELLILLAIIFIALAISVLYPFYRGVHEGLTSAELDSAAPIRKALLKYTNQVESNCQQMINSISSLSGLEQTETLSINTIIGNTNFTNTAKFQQIISLNSKNEVLTDALNTIQGKNFSLLETIILHIENDLNVSRNCFTTSSLIDLSKELSEIKSLCDINCCSVLSSLSWANIVSIIQNEQMRVTGTPLEEIALILSIIFVTPHDDILETVIKFTYIIEIGDITF
jgi:hypothetical protein